MKTSTQSGISTLARRSASIFTILATLALTNVAKAADFKGTPSNETTNLTFPIPNHSDAASRSSQPDADATRLEANLHSFSETAILYCYTDFGVTPMRTFAFPGDSCYARLNYWPYSIVWGVVGY
jgi:hypothetical protein